MKFSVCLIIIVTVLISSYPVEAKTVRMAVFKLEPFMMINEHTKEISGVTVDYWKEFLSVEMGVDIEVYGLFPILRASYMLKAGEVDVVSQLTKIPEREAEFLYPETPLTTIISCLLVLKDSPLYTINKPEDLFGKTIGFIEAGYIPDILIHKYIRLDLVTTTHFRDMNYKKLLGKRVDAMLDINYLSFMYWLEKQNDSQKVRFIMLPTEPVPVYSIFRNTSEGADLRDAYDKANRKGIKEKVFDKMIQRYLN